MSGPTIIIGGGIGGFTVARELRQLGYQAPITIIDSHGLPYDRPPLSKEVLTGAKTVEDLHFVPAAWYRDNNVQVLTGTVSRIDPTEKNIILTDGSAHPYEHLVLATGGHARRGDTPGFHDEDVIVLRTTDDALRLKGALGPGVVLGVIGAGLIGAEVASSARELGAEVILIDPAPVALVPAVGPELAHRLHDLHAEHGVRFLNATTSAVRRSEGKFILEIDGQSPVTVDHVLLAIGLIPDESLAASAGLDRDGGVLVDREQRTSCPDIWAVGDCSRRRNPDGSLERRHEHWEAAVHDAAIAAAAIAGAPAPPEKASWFWSDRYGVHVEGVGSMTAAGSTVIRPDPEGHPAVAFRVTADHKLVGAASYNDSMAIRGARRIIDRDLDVDPEQLADPAVPIKKLAR